jgi:hypothetical protein
VILNAGSMRGRFAKNGYAPGKKTHVSNLRPKIHFCECKMRKLSKVIPAVAGVIHSDCHAQALYLARVLLIHVAEMTRYPDRHE